jgi:two-component system, NarL family, sensor histidine kinase DesK
MRRLTGSWWHELSGPAKFRIYSRVTLQATALAVVVTLAVQAPGAWAAVGLVLCGLAAAAVVEVQPGLGSVVGRRYHRPVVLAGTTALVAIWAAYALVARTGDREPAQAAGICAAIVLVLAVLPFVRHRWWWLLAVAVATGLAFGEDWAARALLTATLLGFGGFALLSMLFTLSGLEIVDDLERARDLESRLRVADERLRFARDLHDVVGRGFSVVAVKSELAATLARAGAADRAAAEMDEVRTVAVESMEQMRELVRGYRDIDLEGEVAGARSLLAAVGCRLTVEGEPARLPARFHETAAWVTREGTTNIVKHARATTAVLAFGGSGMSLRNDGVHAAMNETSGLRGLAERVAQVGAGLRTRRTEEEFVLEIVWDTP